MSTQARRHTGSASSPAIYSSAVAERFLQGAAGFYWESCNEGDPSRARNEKGQRLTTYSLLVRAEQIPSRLVARAHSSWADSDPADRTLVRAPTTVAAIGDSVIWGQGLDAEQKYHVRLAEALELATGRPVRTTREPLPEQAGYFPAHSGATVDPSPSRVEVLLNDVDPCGNPQFHGEVPRHHPTIDCQLRALPEPERIDFIVMNGCINDVGPFEVAVGLREDTYELFERPEMRERIEESCRTGMEGLLRRVRLRAPNARVLVIGYFPLLSAGSLGSCPQQQVVVAGVTLLSGAGSVAGSALAVIGIVALMGPGALPMIPVVATAGAAAGAATTAGISAEVVDAYLAELGLRNQEWVDRSNSALLGAVQEIQSADDDLQDELFDLGAGSVRFVPVGSNFFGRETFTPDAWLWGVDCGGNTTDPARARRLAECPEHSPDRCAYRGSCEADVRYRGQCDRGAAFHPNVEGAAEISRRLLEAAGLSP